MLDFVQPKQNESQFLETAKELGLKLCFVYDAPLLEPKSFPTAHIVSSVPKKKDISTFDFLIIDCSRQTRVFAELKQQAILINCELNQTRDNLAKINSGIDDVIASLMKKNNKIYAINLSNLFNQTLPLYVLLKRISQNIKLCRKYEVPFVPMTLSKEPIELKNPSDIRSFLSLFKVSPHEIKQAISFFDCIV